MAGKWMAKWGVVPLFAKNTYEILVIGLVRLFRLFLIRATRLNAVYIKMWALRVNERHQLRKLVWALENDFSCKSTSVICGSCFLRQIHIEIFILFQISCGSLHFRVTEWDYRVRPFMNYWPASLHRRSIKTSRSHHGVDGYARRWSASLRHKLPVSRNRISICEYRASRIFSPLRRSKRLRLFSYFFLDTYQRMTELGISLVIFGSGLLLLRLIHFLYNGCSKIVLWMYNTTNGLFCNWCFRYIGLSWIHLRLRESHKTTFDCLFSAVAYGCMVTGTTLDVAMAHFDCAYCDSGWNGIDSDCIQTWHCRWCHQRSVGLATGRKKHCDSRWVSRYHVHHWGLRNIYRSLFHKSVASEGKITTIQIRTLNWFGQKSNHNGRTIKFEKKHFLWFLHW